ncbi:hypothetical protein [Croceivirga thetidis]|uniref:DUF4848 domain-containing protein n=1 Tax=Croceivirga thetidis TaxID=2721623 RepID=A0ABX1GT44_9FLAO|nr:hypothetical protein [Croceivirga thetidis]NKI32794.1 hypothetical protein [Croceivirga thetidis]
MKYYTHILLVSSILLLVISCSKNEEEIIDSEQIFDVNASFEKQIMSIPNNSFTDESLITEYSEIMKEVLTMAKDAEFRNYIYKESVNESNAGDDYLVNIVDVSDAFKSKGGAFSKSSENLGRLDSKIRSIDASIEPMVFFPKAETIEDRVIANKNYDVSKNLNEPIAVLKGAYNDDYSAPGYTLNANGDLVYNQMINEDFAWNNDVYVIGARENTGLVVGPCGEENYQKNSNDCYATGGGGGGGSSTRNTRVNGRAELGGELQVTSDLNEIEHWFSGKLEFRMVVAGVEGSAATVIRDLAFGKVKRKHFRDKKWYDYDVFLFNWNLNNLGDFNIEKWIEVDGGPTGEISITLPGRAAKPASGDTPAVSAFPGGTAKVSFKRDDDDLGVSLIQFTDDLTQEYSLGKIKIRRN